MPGKLLILCGEDDFSVREALERAKAELGPREAVAPNTARFEGRHLALTELHMACNTVPFLADYRLVVVEGLLERFEERANPRPARRAAKTAPSKAADEWAPLPDMIKAMPPTTTLVLVSGRLTPKNAMLDRLRPLGGVQEFPVLRAAELQGWIQARVTKQKGTITTGAVRLLADFVGGNLRQLDNEVQKLCTYVEARTIDEDTVRLLVGDTREANIFALVDGLVRGNRAQATTIVRQLIDQGEPAPKMLATLAQQFRMMIQVKGLTDSGASYPEIMRVTGAKSDFAIQKARQNGQAYRFEDLKAIYQRLLDTDLAIKTGAASEDFALELLVIELASGPAPHLSRTSFSGKDAAR